MWLFALAMLQVMLIVMLLVVLTVRFVSFGCLCWPGGAEVHPWELSAELLRAVVKLSTDPGSKRLVSLSPVGDDSCQGSMTGSLGALPLVSLFLTYGCQAIDTAGNVVL